MHRNATRGSTGCVSSFGDGLVVPRGAADRSYGLVIAVAVFIHCPAEVTASNVASAWRVLAPGGQIRIQMLADPEDPTGILEAAAPVESTESLAQEVHQVVEESSEEERALSSEDDYMGHRFAYDEAHAMLQGVDPSGEVTLYRGDPYTVYGMLARPE